MAENLEMYILDVRVGCIAVYSGPKVNCIQDAEDKFVFCANGTWDGHKWSISETDLENAKRVADELNKLLFRTPTPSNEALSLEELRGMDGERVWVQYRDIGMYALVAYHADPDGDDGDDVYLTNNLGGRDTYEEVIGHGGVVFRRPPEGE